MIAISQPHDFNLKSLVILTNGKLVTLTKSSFLRIVDLAMDKKIQCLEQQETELALVTLWIRKEN